MSRKQRMTLMAFAAVLLLATGCSDLTDEACEHLFSEWSITTEATCTEDGKQTRTCEKCGQIEEQAIKAPGHTPGEDDGDCTTAVTCTVCEAVVVPANSHDFSGEYVCDADGHWHICANEGCGVTEDRIAHTPDREQATEEHAKICTVCGYIIQEHLVHDYNVLRSDESGHWYQCRCGKADPDAAKQAHTGIEADDCAVDHVCDHCGYIIKAHDHVAGKDDGNCTTPVGCINCGQNAVAGTNGHQDNDGDHVCDNPGCQVVVGVSGGNDEGIDLPMDRN